MDKRKFSRLVAKRVKDSGMTRVAIAKAAGLAESHIRACEQGTMPSVLNAHKLLAALGCRLTIGQPDGENLG